MTEDPHTFPPGAATAEGCAPYQPPAAARLAVTVTPGPHHHTARVSGEIDTDVAGHLADVLERALHDGATGLDIDMSRVTFCDCQGLNVLLRLRQAALHMGHTLTITDPGPPLKRVLALTGATALFTVPLDGATPVNGTPGTAPIDGAAPLRCTPLTGGAAPRTLDIPHDAGGLP